MSLAHLPASTVRLLGSSQVITSVSSVVKELMENSFDAGATTIEVKLEKHGLDRIEVKDDGSGIVAEDCLCMALPHYTSKISEFSDLEKIQSYGFRGEALYSLCSIASVQVITRTADDEMARGYVFDETGKVVESKVSHGNKGTTVIVTNLFKNLPVRKQVMSIGKRVSEELKKVECIVKNLAVIHPKVRVSLAHNKFLIWQKTSVAHLKLSVMQIISHNITRQLHHIIHNVDELKIELLVPKRDCDIQTVCNGSLTDNFHLFINKRPVRDKKFEKLFSEVYNFYYGCYLPSNKFPVTFVALIVPPDTIDVNLEPNKTRIFMKDQDKLIEYLKELLSQYYCDDFEEKPTVNNNSNRKRKAEPSSEFNVKKSPAKPNNLGNLSTNNRVDVDDDDHDLVPVYNKVTKLTAVNSIDTITKEDINRIPQFNDKVAFLDNSSEELLKDSPQIDLQIPEQDTTENHITKSKSFSDLFDCSSKFLPSNSNSKVFNDNLSSSEISTDSFKTISGSLPLSVQLSVENSENSEKSYQNSSEAISIDSNIPEMINNSENSEKSYQNSSEAISIDSNIPEMINNSENSEKSYQNSSEAISIDSNIEIINKNSENSEKSYQNSSEGVCTDCNVTGVNNNKMNDYNEKISLSQWSKGNIVDNDKKIQGHSVLLNPYLQTTESTACGKENINCSDKLVSDSNTGKSEISSLNFVDELDSFLNSEKGNLLLQKITSETNKSENYNNNFKIISESSNSVVKDIPSELRASSEKSIPDSIGEDILDRSVSSQMGRKEMSAFTKFAREMRSKILKQSPGLSFTTVADMLAKKWRSLQAEERDKYEKMCSDEKRKRKDETPDKVVSKKPKTRERVSVKVDVNIETIIERFVKEFSSKHRVEDDSCLRESDIDIIGQIESSDFWTYKKTISRDEKEIGMLSLTHLQEAHKFRQNMEMMIIPTKILEDNIPITESNLGPDLWNVLMSLEFSFDKNSNTRLIDDKRITMNGFKIMLTEDDDGKKIALLTDVALNINFYGINDLRETLQLIQRHGKDCYVDQTRCLNAIKYIRSETVRQCSQSVLRSNKSDVSALLNLWWNDPNKAKKCPHEIDVIVPFYTLRD